MRNGYREGRSPDVMAVTKQPSLGFAGTLWPSLDQTAPVAPIGFMGYGVHSGIRLSSGGEFDDIAPTVAEILGLRRPHPRVRAGHSLANVADGRRPRLVLEVAGKGIGGQAFRSGTGDMYPMWHRLQRRGAMASAGAAGSLPDDPAAVLTTIGTGGLPSQHGITGTLLRNDRGRVVRAWGRAAPVPVIAGLADDLDRRWHQRSRVGVVAGDVADRGIAGGNWYLGHDRDDFRLVRSSERNEERAVGALLRSGYGHDGIPDLLAVVLDVGPREFAASTARLYAAARRAAHGKAALVVVGTGAAPAPATGTRSVVHRLEKSFPRERILAQSAPGGLFLDQRSLTRASLSNDAVARALLRQRVNGASIFADAFTGTAIAFARYC
jgi:hypothetical protein